MRCGQTQRNLKRQGDTAVNLQSGGKEGRGGGRRDTESGRMYLRVSFHMHDIRRFPSSLFSSIVFQKVAFDVRRGAHYVITHDGRMNRCACRGTSRPAHPELFHVAMLEWLNKDSIVAFLDTKTSTYHILARTSRKHKIASFRVTPARNTHSIGQERLR